MLESRKYRENIALLFVSCVSDDFGKRKQTEKKEVLKTFAKVFQINSARTRIENTDAQEIAYRFTVRYTDIKFNAVAWRGKEYMVESVINPNERNRELIINAQLAE